MSETKAIEKKKALIRLGDEDRKMVFSMGVLADLEEAGYEAQQVITDITTGGKTAPLLFLAWLLLGEGREEGQKEISLDDLRKLPPYMRMELIASCLAAVRDGFMMETSNDGGPQDPVLAEIEKKRTPDA